MFAKKKTTGKKIEKNTKSPRNRGEKTKTTKKSTRKVRLNNNNTKQAANDLAKCAKHPTSISDGRRRVVVRQFNRVSDSTVGERNERNRVREGKLHSWFASVFGVFGESVSFHCHLSLFFLIIELVRGLDYVKNMIKL